MSVDVFVYFPLCSSRLCRDVCQCLGVEVYLKTMKMAFVSLSFADIYDSAS